MATTLIPVVRQLPPMPDEVRHLFRSLLRAVTYLPDSTARTYLHNHIVWRFRGISNKINRRAENGTEYATIIAAMHNKERTARGRQALTQLQRAGKGVSDDLFKVLSLTYGRTGKRRRYLVTRMLEPDETTIPEDQEALEMLLKKEANGPNQLLRFSPYSKFMIFLKSQRANQPAELAKSFIRHEAPQIPDKNVWGRPTPMKRQRTMMLSHWASVMDRMLPPVPIREWNRLRDLSTGAIEFEGLRPRRSRPPCSPRDEDENTMDVLKYFTTPANFHTSSFSAVRFDPGWGARSWGEPVEDVKLPATSTPVITGRQMRRLYSRIWSMTPTMTRDPYTNEWVVKWGGQQTKAHAKAVAARAKRDAEFFENLPEDAPSQQPPKGRQRPQFASNLHEKIPPTYEHGSLLRRAFTIPPPKIRKYISSPH